MKRLFASLILLFTVSANANGDQCRAPSGEATTTPQLIPRAAFFSHPNRMRVRMSPDGQMLTFMGPAESNGSRGLGIFMAPMSDSDNATLILQDISARMPMYQWTKNPRKILFLRDIDGNENEQLYLLDVLTREATNITNNPEVKTRIVGQAKKNDNVMIYSSNARDRRIYDYYTLNVETGEVASLYENTDEFLSVVFDDDLKPRLAIRYGDDGQMVIFKRAADSTEWSIFFEVPFLNVTNFELTAINWERNLLYIADSRGRDKAALKSVNLVDGSEQVLRESDLADITGGLTTEDGSEILAVSYEYTRTEYLPMTTEFGQELAQLRNVVPGADFQLMSRTRDDQKWLLAFLQDTKSIHYYMWDRTTRSGRLIHIMEPELDALPLQQMRPLVIPSRDGLNMVSYLTLPEGVALNQEGRASRAVPMVLYVHGGPWARDEWGYHPIHQWLANRGYAVLSVNYRGSTGFGSAFESASYGEWGRKMHDDLIDASDWAKRMGIAIPDRIAIMGGSYGGYAALVGLTMTPEYFAASIAEIGPSDLVTLDESKPPYWKPFEANHIRRMGANASTPEGREFLRSRSPLTYADRARRPLLLGHGDQDPRVKVAESVQMAEALVRLNLPVTLARFRDEGHGLVRPQNRQSFYGVVEGFLAQHLGGCAQQLEMVEGTTMNVQFGRDQVPGLADALRRLGR